MGISGMRLSILETLLFYNTLQKLGYRLSQKLCQLCLHKFNSLLSAEISFEIGMIQMLELKSVIKIFGHFDIRGT